MDEGVAASVSSSGRRDELLRSSVADGGNGSLVAATIQLVH